jgi:hypothetical protein
MKPLIPNRWALLCLVSILAPQFAWARDFEGRITATVTRGGEVETLQYTIGTNCIRIERGENDRPYPKDLIARDTGAVTLLFPNNRSFVQLKSRDPNPPTMPPGFPAPTQMPGAMGTAMQPLPPPAIGPTNLPGTPARPQMPATPQLPPGVGPQPSAPGGGAMAAMPAMPMPAMPMEKMELKATADTTNLLGYTCVRYELSLRGEAMEIWATDKLPAFEPYLQNQLRRFGPRMIEDQWGELLKAKKLFPLLAVLRFAPPSPPSGAAPALGPERLRFEVKSITPEKIEDGALFQPPPDYHELPAMPF